MSDPSGHLDVESLSDLDEGLLSTSLAASARAHLVECAECRHLQDDLAELRVLLSSLPDPGPMPELVARRIGAALASASSTTPSLTVLPGNSERRPSSGRRRWLSPAVLGGVAAGAIVVASAAVALTQGERHSGSSDSVAGGAASAPVLTADQPGFGTERKAAVPGGTAYTAANLAMHVDALLTAGNTATPRGASAPAIAPDGNAATEGADPLARLRQPAELEACVDATARTSAEPAAVDYGTYDGTPAVVVVVRAEPAGSGRDPFAAPAVPSSGAIKGPAAVPTSGPSPTRHTRPSPRVAASGSATSYDVYVVGADCRAGHTDTLTVRRLTR